MSVTSEQVISETFFSFLNLMYSVDTITVVPSLLLSNFVIILRSCKSWVHVSCALWIPEVGFGNVSKMEPITRIENIPVSCDCITFYL